MDNREIADVLQEIAVFSELSGENPFKARAFATVARSIERHPESAAALCQQGRLREIKGVGSSTEEIVVDLVTRGRSRLLEQLKSAFPPRITELLSLAGMGPKKVKAVYDKLGVSTVGELEYACRENRLVTLEGFGEKTQANILKAIEFRKTTQSSRLYSEALAIGDELVNLCQRSQLFASVDIAGSLRRGKASFKDIDILLVPDAVSESETVQQFLLALADDTPEGKAVIGAGETKVSIRRHGMQVDFRIIPRESWASALQHFTGSKEHNTLLRSRVKSAGLKMNEYGIFRDDRNAIPAKDEESVYRSLGLAWIPPEIREADGEIEAAEAGALPDLLADGDCKGMIHAHSTFSDGASSIEDLARGCMERGYSWLCLSDHSRSAIYAGGLSVEQLAEQAREVKRLNRELAPFRIFHGIESDILPDGSLDYAPEVLARLDFVIGSIHSKLSMDKTVATERLIAAISNPSLTILGHPSGRILLSRDGYPFDQALVLSALASHGVVLEHNCNPHRLDPDWGVLKRAASMGILVSLNTDAHDLEGLDDMRYGIVMSRKAWLSKKNVLNCMSAEEADEFFASKKKG